MECGQSNKLNETIRGRLGFILFIFSAWIIVLMVRLSDFMIFSRDELIAKSPELVVKQIERPAKRGSIMLGSGERLAWSVPFYRVIWNCAQTSEKLNQQLKELDKLGVEVDFSAGCEEFFLVDSSDLKKIKPLVEASKKFNWLDLRVYFKRNVAENSEVDISEIETKYDKKLSGDAGLYEVVFDRRGELIPERCVVIKPLKNGEDVVIDLEEIDK